MPTRKPIIRKQEIVKAWNDNKNFKSAGDSLGISESCFKSIFYSYKSLANELIGLNFMERFYPLDQSKMFVRKEQEYEERYNELKSYKVEEYIPTVGKYFLPNGQLV